jgi:hypothetical protein
MDRAIPACCPKVRCREISRSSGPGRHRAFGGGSGHSSCARRDAPRWGRFGGGAEVLAGGAPPLFGCLGGASGSNFERSTVSLWPLFTQSRHSQVDKRGWFNVECAGDVKHVPDCRLSQSAFQQERIGAVAIGSFSKHLLSNPRSFPGRPQGCKCFGDLAGIDRMTANSRRDHWSPSVSSPST